MDVDHMFVITLELCYELQVGPVVPDRDLDHSIMFRSRNADTHTLTSFPFLDLMEYQSVTNMKTNAKTYSMCSTTPLE